MNQVSTAITNAVSDSLRAIANYLPHLIAAIIIFLIGVLVAVIIRNLVVRLLNAVNLEKALANTGIPEALKKTDSSLSVTQLVGELLRWTVILIFLVPAVQQLGLSSLSDIINAILRYIPNVIIAVIIVVVGLVVARVARDFVVAGASSLGTETARTVGLIARWAIVIFSLLAALTELGVAPDLIRILFTGFVAMVAIAGGLAFGLGGRDTAESMLKRIRDELNSKK